MKTFREYIYPRLFLDMLPFYPLLMVLGWLASGATVDYAFVLGLVANYIMLMFAFLINDIEDRADDARSQFKSLGTIRHVLYIFGLYKPTEKADPQTGLPYRRFNNLFSSNYLTVSQGYSALLLMGAISFGLSHLAGGWPVSLVALSNIGIGLLYSLKSVRLKSVILADVLSHAYLLAGAQILYFMLYPSAELNAGSWILFAGGYLFSLAGDLDNEYRDFDEDRAAGIRNTSLLLGKERTNAMAKLIKVLSILICVGGGVLTVAVRYSLFGL